MAVPHYTYLVLKMPSELKIPEKTDTANKPQPSEEVQVKSIDLGTGDNSKTNMIGVGLDPK
jgi:hypothetical protein